MLLAITPDEIQLITGYVYQLSGIKIDSSKKYLLETRLSPLAIEHQCTSYQELHQKATGDRKKHIERQIIDAITTNETLFFRDAAPFQLLQHKILPELINTRSTTSIFAKPPIRIWSAACSTGQELYSIAIVLKKLLGDTSKYTLKLFGTDISEAAISQAIQGKYTKFEIERGLDRNTLQTYFRLEDGFWKIKDEISDMTSFRKFNLFKPFAGLGTFDIIFCRNVAIYFALEDRKKLFQKLASILAPDGYLIIGSTESLTGISPHFIPHRHLRSLYYTIADK